MERSREDVLRGIMAIVREETDEAMRKGISIEKTRFHLDRAHLLLTAAGLIKAEGLIGDLKTAIAREITDLEATRQPNLPLEERPRAPELGTDQYPFTIETMTRRSNQTEDVR